MNKNKKVLKFLKKTDFKHIRRVNEYYKKEFGTGFNFLKICLIEFLPWITYVTGLLFFQFTVFFFVEKKIFFFFFATIFLICIFQITVIFCSVRFFFLLDKINILFPQKKKIISMFSKFFFFIFLTVYFLFAFSVIYAHMCGIFSVVFL